MTGQRKTYNLFQLYNSMFHLLIHEGFQIFRKQTRQLSFSTVQTGLWSDTSALGKSSSQQSTQTQKEFNKAKWDEFSACSQEDRAKKWWGEQEVKTSFHCIYKL